MMLKTFVKVSGVNNLSDARYCAGMGVDVIGFNIDPELGEAIDPKKFGEISSWLAGADYAIEGDMLTATVVAPYDVAYVESSQQSQLSLLSGDYKKILRINIADAEDLQADVDLVLIEGPDALDEKQQQQIQKLAQKHQVLLACGFNDQNVLDVLNKTQVYGIAIKAGDEIRPGFKDYDELANILEQLETDD